MVSLNKKVYAIGTEQCKNNIGRATLGSPLSAKVEVYDPTTETWSPSQPMYAARTGMGKLLI